MIYLFETTVFILIPLNTGHTVFLPYFSFYLGTCSFWTWSARLASANIARLVSRNVILSLCSSKTVSLIIVSLYQTRPTFSYHMNQAIHRVIYVWANFKWIKSMKFELQKFTRQMVLQCRRDTGTTTLRNASPQQFSRWMVKACVYLLTRILPWNTILQTASGRS